MSTSRRRLLIISFAGLLIVVPLIIAEFALRLWGYSELSIYDPIYIPFEKSEDIPYVHRPNLVHARAHGLAIINTDSLGLRSRTAGLRYGPKQRNEYRIAITGDSVTFGEGVPSTDDTFAQVLEDTLNQKQTAVKVQVFNYGESAFSVRQMAATLQHRMRDIDPDLVIMSITPPDFDITRTPGLDASGYMVDARLARGNFLTATFRGAIRSLRVSYVIRDLVYFLFVSRPDVTGLLDRGQLPESYSYVRQFKETADTSGLRSIIVLLPNRRKPWLDSVTTQLMRDGIESVDLSPIGMEFTEEQYRASTFDQHPSAAVHHRIGLTLADHILSTGLTNR